MNTETGTVYMGEEILAAMKRGEPVVPVSERVYDLMKAGQRAMGQGDLEQRITALEEQAKIAARKEAAEVAGIVLPNRAKWPSRIPRIG